MRSIFVPLDGTGFGEHALPMALALARRSGAAVHLAHVHNGLEAVQAEVQLFDSRLDDDLRSSEQKYLDRLQAQLSDLANIDIGARLLEGDTVPALCAEAGRVAADLVVMATHARGWFGRLWFGDTADALERALSMPLLLVHPTDNAPDPSADVVPRHLLVPLDGTPRAERILPLAADFARLVGADLTLLRIVEPLAPYAVPDEVGIVVDLEVIARVENLQERLEQDAAAYLAGVADRLRGDGLTVHTTVAQGDDPDAAIVREARRPIDLIALVTHGRHGLARLLHGSIADGVLRGSPLPILVHREPGA